MNWTEKPFDTHFTDRQTANALAKEHGGRVRNDSHRLFGGTQTRLKTPHYAVRIRPRSFGHKVEITTQAREMGSVPDPWK